MGCQKVSNTFKKCRQNNGMDSAYRKVANTPPAIIRNDSKTQEKGNNLFSQPSLLRNRQKNMLRLQKTKGWRVEMMQRPSSTNSMQDLSEKNSNLFRSSRASSAEGSSRGSTRMNDNNLLMTNEENIKIKEKKRRKNELRQKQLKL